MASGSSSSKLDSGMHCATCGIHRFWTSRSWDCDDCADYFLSENCYKGSLGDSEVSSVPHHVRCGDRPLSAHITIYTCDGCESSPIWNLRWHCTVCPDFDLCEVCNGGLDAADMPSEHSKEHAMTAIEVMLPDKLLEFYPSFSKPMDPQWSYNIQEHRLSLVESGFEWVKREPLAKVLDIGHMSMGEDVANMQTLLETSDNNINHSSPLEKQIIFNHRSSFGRRTSETIPIQRAHKIFLSHAGPEKDFVEQLKLDLSRVHHFGIFFDKDDESLPKGEPFPPRIFDAAEHCELAIVIISDDYFKQKWPMLELVAFVKAQKERPELKILPIFYKLSVLQFKERKRQQSYARHWMKEVGSLISEGEIRDWKEALKVISRTNGLEYDVRMGEVAFRRSIVETVCKRVKPDLVWEDSHVQGKLRIHKMIYEKIRSLSQSWTSTLLMGLYGMGGCGKTTMCRVIGNQVMKQYLGQVCHIEFGSADILQLLKKVLQCICSLKSSLVMKIDEGQAWNLLKVHISEKRICLMIDNVLDHDAFIDEARSLLKLPFMEGSLILVTSRSCMTLGKLNVEWGAQMKIPSLNMDEAKALFAHHSGCDTSNLLEDQKQVMKKFLDRCNFKVENMVSREIHPLALKVLGSRAGANPEEWVNVDIDFKDYGDESKHDIFAILRLSYDTLNPSKKRMFLDLAFTLGRQFRAINEFYFGWLLRCLYDKKDKQFQSNLVKDFLAKSLVEFVDESGFIYIHDLYCEFALMEVKKNELKHSPCCFFSRPGNGNHVVQERRVCIYNHPTSSITKDMSSCAICSRMELFSMFDCPNLESVNVLEMLHLKIFMVESGCPELRSVNLAGAMNLKYLYWNGFEGQYADLTLGSESLELLSLFQEECPPPTTLQGSLDFSRLSKLERLWLTYLPLSLLNLNQAVCLDHLQLDNCQHLERLEGLEALVQLQSIFLKACSSLVEFPSLSNFPSLREFCLEGAAKLQQIHGFANLTSLTHLSLRGGKELEELSGIESCTKLVWMDLSGTSIKDCAWLSLLKELKTVSMSGTKIRVVPDCSNLCKLSELWLDDCQVLKSLGSEWGSIYPRLPKNLQRLSASRCTRLKAIPQFPLESTLKYLVLDDTWVDDVSSVIHCEELERLWCSKTPITSLPDLSSLTRLKTLAVYKCKLLTRMDNTKSLPALEELYVAGCTNLSALPDLSSSTGLTKLSLFGCPLVNPNLVKLPSGSTIDMEMGDNVTNHSENDDDAQECEILTTLDFEKPEVGHDQWRFVRIPNLVAIGSLVVWWIGRRRGMWS